MHTEAVVLGDLLLLAAPATLQQCVKEKKSFVVHVYSAPVKSFNTVQWAEYKPSTDILEVCIWMISLL